MITPLTIRRYQADDRKAVWILWHTALGNLTPDQVPPMDQYDGDHDLKDIPTYYLAGDGEFLIGLYQGQMAAICGMTKSAPERGHIRHMSVHIDFQRHGFGRQIMAAMEDRALELGCKTLHLDTSVGQLPAQQFYLALGFREVGRDVVGVGRWEIILYEKNLTA